MNLNEISENLNNHGISTTTYTISDYHLVVAQLNAGKSVIAHIRKNKHRVTIDRIEYIDNVPYYMIRDSAYRPRAVRADILSKHLSGNIAIVED